MSSNGTSAEVLPLPKGGGATRGLGDGFTPDFNRGTGSYSIPIEIPTGYRGLKPNLTLIYNSAASNGAFGFGWDLGLPRIQIDTDKGVADYQNPRYVFSGESLVEAGGGRFYPRVENQFNRIIRQGDYWEVTDKAGTTTIYGSTSESRISEIVDGAEHIFAWLPDKICDTSGNEMRFFYLRDGNNLYLEQIDYAIFQIKLFYEARHDSTANRRSGFTIEYRLRCSAIEISRPLAENKLIRRYSLTYSSDIHAPSLLTNVLMRGFKSQSNGSILETVSPPLTLVYTPFEPENRSYCSVGVGDLDSPGQLGENGYELLDLSGDGLPDIVQLGFGRPRFWKNLGNCHFSPPVCLKDFPDVSTLGDSRIAVFDVNGEGSADLVFLGDGRAHYFPNLSNGSFDRPRYLGKRSPIDISFDDPDARLADINGDGKVDLLKTTSMGLVVWNNLGGHDGFEIPKMICRERGPVEPEMTLSRDHFPNVMLSDPGVHITDMTGDGLPDIVHIQNNYVEYWPSLGGGRYDNRIVMESPPILPRHFDNKRLFVSDIDGSGSSDIIYVGLDKVIVWLNVGGQRFAPPIEIFGVPLASSDSIRLVDLLGSGTIGVLWSSIYTAHNPGYRFLSFSDSKPYLLTSINNGIGLETQIEYGSSTAHASRDRKEGMPWKTNLPMPVHVINRVTQRDLINGAESTTEILYHNGRFDPETRRFRGFGNVTARRITEPDRPSAYEEHYFLVGASGEPHLGLDDPKKINLVSRGQVYKTIYLSKGPESKPLRIENCNWHISIIEDTEDSDPILFPHIISTEVQNLEGEDHPRVVTASYRYDEFGNVLEEVRTGTAPNGNDNGEPVASLTAITRMEYAINSEKYIVDHVARTTRFDDSGKLIAEVRHYYDGHPLVGLSLGQVDRGLLSRQEEVVITIQAAEELYGADNVDWIALGYHQVVRTDGVLAWAVNCSRLRHNARGMLIQSVNPLGAGTKVSYDPDGLLVVQTKNHMGHVISAKYDESWQKIEHRTDANGKSTSYSYDGLGRLLNIVRPGDSAGYPSERYIYSDFSTKPSLRIQKRRKAGTEEIYDKIVYFDGFGRSIQERAIVDGDKVRVSGPISYMVNGEPAKKGEPIFRIGLDYEPSSTLPAGPQFIYEYDGIGRLIKATNLEGKQTRIVITPWSTFHYDVNDTDPQSPHADTPRIEHFDAFGRLIGVTLYSTPEVAHSARYIYDLLGRLKASTDLEGRPALLSAVYDGRGARLKFTHAVSGTRTLVYDAARQVVRYWDERNIVVERSHDSLNRLVTESVGGVVQERYHWDLSKDQIGTLGRVEDSVGTVIFHYDEVGRVTEKIRKIKDKKYILKYEYDAAGLQNRQIYPDGSNICFSRWGDGRIRSLGGFIKEAKYNDVGRLEELSHENGVIEKLRYNISGYVNEMTVRHETDVLRSTTLVHDSAGHLTNLKENAAPLDRAEDYEYDGLDRLIRFDLKQDGNITSKHYDLDADGNIRCADEMLTANFKYDFTKPGALIQRTTTSGVVEKFSFDKAGHMTAFGDTKLTFDARGYLIKVEKPNGTIVEMAYDYRGARAIKKITGSPKGNYEVRYIDDLYEERAKVGTAYIYLSGRLVGMCRGEGVRHLHTDHRASVVLSTKPNGKEDRRAWFGPYGLGENIPYDEISRQFISAVFDMETELYYFNHRYYSPTIGRFISPDPRFLARPEIELEYPEAHNLFVYSRGDPVDYIDPTGQGFWSTLGKVLAGIVVVGAIVAAVVVAALVVAAAMAAGGWMIVLGATALGALIGGIQGGWEGAALGAMIGFTAGVNFMVGGPVLGAITFMGIFKGVRQEGWYKSLAGWSSWFMPASWPGHILGLGVFLANGIAHVFGSDKQIQSFKFDWKHGQILTAGGEFGGSMLPGIIKDAPAHSLGGFSFYTNELWSQSSLGGFYGHDSWDRMPIRETVEHETGHMISNAVFGFWQGIIQGIQNSTQPEHNERLFEKIAESNESTPDYGRDLPFYG